MGNLFFYSLSISRNSWNITRKYRKCIMDVPIMDISIHSCHRTRNRNYICNEIKWLKMGNNTIKTRCWVNNYSKSYSYSPAYYFTNIKRSNYFVLSWKTSRVYSYLNWGNSRIWTFIKESSKIPKLIPLTFLKKIMNYNIWSHSWKHNYCFFRKNRFTTWSGCWRINKGSSYFKTNHPRISILWNYHIEYSTLLWIIKKDNFHFQINLNVFFQIIVTPIFQIILKHVRYIQFITFRLLELTFG